MALEKIVKPVVTEDAAKEIVLRIYGFKVLCIQRMISYDDCNYHVKFSDEHTNPFVKDVNPDGYTLKVINTVKSAISGHFDSIHSAMKHLHEKGLQVPQLVPTLKGETWTFSSENAVDEIQTDEWNSNIPKPNRFGVYMLTYIPGVPFSTITYTEDVLFQWGALLAKFHHAMKDFKNSTLKDKIFLWNLQSVPQIENYMYILDKTKSDLVSHVLKNYQDQVAVVLPTLPKSYIHGDFNDNNVLVTQQNGRYKVEGILDFEDMHYGTYAWDVALMLAYSCIECGDMDILKAMGFSLAGYLSHRPLSQNETSLLKVLAACRLCQSLVYGAHSHSLEPENDYILTTSKTGWTKLTTLWNTPNDVILELWRNIAEQHPKE